LVRPTKKWTDLASEHTPKKTVKQYSQMYNRSNYRKNRERYIDG